MVSDGAAHSDEEEKIAGLCTRSVEKERLGSGNDGNKYIVDWEENDAENPRNWSTGRKVTITALVSVQALITVANSSSYLSGSAQMSAEFGLSNVVITLGLTLYLVGLALGPLMLAPLSELYGRNPIYFISVGLFLLFQIPCGIAPNFTVVLIFRFVGGFAGAPMITNSGGSIGDMFSQNHRLLAFSVFSLAPFNGPVIGPIFAESLSFRWITWILTITSGVSLAFMLVFLKETYQPVLLQRRAAKLRKETGELRYRSRYCPVDGGETRSLLRTLRVNMTRPILMAFIEPICCAWALYCAVIYGILYLSFASYAIIFQEMRGWSLGVSGLSFLGLGIGTTLAIVANPFSQKVYYRHPIDPATGQRQPEARLPPMFVAAFLCPIGLFWFAFTCTPPYHWAIPIASGILFGCGATLIFINSQSYLIDSYQESGYVSSALASNALCRSIFGGVTPLFTPAFYHNLGPRDAGIILAAVSAAFVPTPYLFYKFGRRLREYSRYNRSYEAK